MMRVDEFLAGARALPFGDLRTITGGAALVVAPHPDDESLGCGGLIAEACAQGEPPIVAVLTDGTGSHPNSRAYPSQRLRDIREAEARSAVACLGLPDDRIFFLRNPDRQAPSKGPEFNEAVTRLVGLVRHFGCRSILASWGSDPHSDHVATHNIAMVAAQVSEVVHRAYPVWGLTLPPESRVPGHPAGLRLDIARHLPAKRRAIRSHLSQHAGLIDDDPSGFQMTAEFMALFEAPYEIFLDVPPEDEPA
jgi:LmbE family N-acetylglucosaminyl deacetylase